MAVHRAVPCSSPAYTIYAFINLYLNCEKGESNKKEAGITKSATCDREFSGHVNANHFTGTTASTTAQSHLIIFPN